MTRLTTLKDTLMTYMTQGNAHDDPGPFEAEGFREGGLYYLSVDSPTADHLLEAAVKIRNYVQQNGQIETDAQLENIPGGATEAYNPAYRYYSRVGPIAVSHPDLSWNTTYGLADNAPRRQSDRFKEEASALAIPEHEDHIPTLVKGFYDHLRAVKDRENRGAHPRELTANATVQTRKRQYNRAFRRLKQLPWVKPPKDAPAWTLVEEEALSGSCEPDSATASSESTA